MLEQPKVKSITHKDEEILLPSQYCGLSYLTNVLDPERLEARLTAAETLIKRNKRNGLKVDALAFCGHSGCIFAPQLATRLDLHMILVRKPGIVSTHENSLIQADHRAITAKTHYLFVDDLISSGATRLYVHKIITAYDAGIDAGYLTYGDKSFSPVALHFEKGYDQIIFDLPIR